MEPAEGILALAIASVGAWMVISGIYRGAINGEDGYSVSRIDRPIRFWLETTIGVLITVGCAGFAIMKLWDL